MYANVLKYVFMKCINWERNFKGERSENALIWCCID